MTEITVNVDCGNAPKKIALRDLNIAFARADVEGILQHFSDDIHWQVVGATDLRGKETVRAALEEMRDVVTSELVIHSIITHGAEGAVNGVITTEQGSSVAFCDVYRFTSASSRKIRSMKSYVVSLDGGD